MKNTNLARSFFYLTIFFFLSISVSAITTIHRQGGGTTWENWGDTGITWGAWQDQSSNLMWASNLPNGNTNLTPITITQSQSFQPLVSDLDRNGKNEIYTFSGNLLSVYNENGIQVNSISLNGTICGTPCIFNKGNDYYGEIAFMMKYSTLVYNMYVVTYIGGTLNITDMQPSIALTTTPTCEMLCGLDFTQSEKIYMPYTDGRIFIWNSDTNTASISANPPTSKAVQWQTGSMLGGGIGAGRFTEHDNTKIVYAQRTPANAYTNITIYDTVTDSFEQVGFTGGSTNNYNYSVVFANIGSPTSSNELIVHWTNPSGSAGLQVFDNTLAEKLDLGLTETIDQINPTVCDFNKDGLNELCVVDYANLYLNCYDSNYNKSWQFNVTSGDFRKTITCADYELNNSFMEFLGVKGIFQIEEGAGWKTRLYEIKDLGTDAQTTGGFIPVILQQSPTLQKDLLYYGSTQFIIYLSNSTTAVCGNSICESGETYYNCFSDCYFGNGTFTNETIGNLPSGTQCINDSWCASGVCDESTQTCTGLPDGSLCTSDTQCYSNVCTDNGICGQTDNVDIIKSLVEMLGFRSTISKLFASIILILVVTGGMGLMGGIYAGGIGALFFGIIGFVGSLIISIFVFGYIAVWLFIAIIIMAVIVAFILYFTNQGSGG